MKSPYLKYLNFAVRGTYTPFRRCAVILSSDYMSSPRLKVLTTNGQESGLNFAMKRQGLRGQCRHDNQIKRWEKMIACGMSDRQTHHWSNRQGARRVDSLIDGEADAPTDEGTQ